MIRVALHAAGSMPSSDAGRTRVLKAPAVPVTGRARAAEGLELELERQAAPGIRVTDSDTQWHAAGYGHHDDDASGRRRLGP